MSSSLRVDILTLFPEMISGYFGVSMLGRAAERGILTLKVHDLRNWAEGKHKVTDDRPFGGGAGMVLKPEPVFAAVEDLQTPGATVIYMAPDGQPLSTPMARDLAASEKHLIILSGHYEGIDQRIRDSLVDREISIGDYVLTNGTIAAAVLVDAVSRYVPGVLGESQSLEQDSFSDGVLSFPQYTRPAEFRGMHVPEILLSGHQARIEAWRAEQAMEKTRSRRPDLILQPTEQL